MSLLNSADDIVCHGEVFKQDRIELPAWHRDRMPPLDPNERDAHAEEFLRALRELNPCKHFGFKLFPEHVSRVPYLHDVVRSPDWKRVILVREPVATYASQLRAVQTGVWTLRGAMKLDSSTMARLHEPVVFTKESLRSFAASYSHFLRVCNRLSALPNTFVISYKQLAKRPALRVLLQFLGSDAKAHSLRSAYHKQFSLSTRDAFENWHELESFLGAHRPFPRLPATSATSIRDIKTLYRRFPVLKAVETTINHRLRVRTAVLSLLPKNSVGAEIGVFTGMFSERIIEHVRPAKLYLVDCWYKLYGETFPSWGPYTAYGKLKTEIALEAVRSRVANSPCAEVVVDLSIEWIARQPDESLDWVYLDTSHQYDTTMAELMALRSKIKREGLVLGDDAWIERGNRHYGVYQAVRDFCRREPFEICHLDQYGQWAVRRSLD